MRKDLGWRSRSGIGKKRMARIRNYKLGNPEDNHYGPTKTFKNIKKITNNTNISNTSVRKNKLLKIFHIIHNVNILNNIIIENMLSLTIWKRKVKIRESSINWIIEYKYYKSKINNLNKNKRIYSKKLTKSNNPLFKFKKKLTVFNTKSKITSHK